MPSSLDILIATEIVTAINAETFSMAFEAERLYAADWSLKDELSSLQVGVWPGDPEHELWERAEYGKTWQVGLTFAKSVKAVSLSDLDALADLVDEVADWLALRDVTAGGKTYANQDLSYLIRFDGEQLDRNKGADGIVKYTGLFASAFTLDYREG